MLSFYENSGATLASNDNKLQFALSLLKELCDSDVDDIAPEFHSSLQFLTEQLSISLMPRKAYKAQTLLWACRLFLHSAKAYEFVRKTYLVLPHQSYLRRLTSFLSSSSRFKIDGNAEQLQYLKSKAKHLDHHQRLVNLLLDEIHVEPSTSFKGGNLVGFAVNQPQQQATTVQAFMISSLLSCDKEVVALVPVFNITAAFFTPADR